MLKTSTTQTQLTKIMTTTYSISISEDNIWAGDGKYDHTTGGNDKGQDTVSGNIRDCPANLEDGAYEAIEDAITDMDSPENGEVEVNGKTYAWTLELDEEEK
jgi:hypothetical protein